MAKVFPSKFELELEKAENLTCLERGCNKTFKHASAFRFHLVKVHKIIKTDADLHLAKRKKMMSEECQYHCPEVNCTYHYCGTSSKFFTSMKLLRQHYKQVHCVKKFVCIMCESKFGRKYDLQRHQTRCSKGIFESPSPIVISDLKEHQIPINRIERTSNEKQVITKNISEEKKLRKILPKIFTTQLSSSLWDLNNLVDRASQHNSTNHDDLTNSRLSEKEIRKSTMTQTNEGLMFRTVSTQTFDDFNHIKMNRKSKGSQVLWSRKNQLTEHENSHTQTNFLTKETLLSYGYCLPQMTPDYQMLIKMNDCETQTLQDLCNLSSSHYLFNNGEYSLDKLDLLPSYIDDPAQRSAYTDKSSDMQFISGSLKSLSSISQQTSYNELLTDINCSAGTQTCDLFEEDNSQDQTLNNIETQTADMLGLGPEEFMSDLEYIDIQTQTNYFLDDVIDHRVHGRSNGLFSDTQTQTHY